MDAKEKLAKRVRLASAFSPSAPINSADLFAGRTLQVERATTAVFQGGQHVVIFGERGVGKTSLANTLYELLFSALEKLDMRVARFNCSGDIKFSALWKGILRELTLETQQPGVGFGSEPVSLEQRLDTFLPDEVSPEDVRFLLQRLPYSTILIFDEVDRITDKGTTVSLADTIKTLSDHGVDTTIILVGVADSVDQIIAEHKSAERALVQIQMPRMSQSELYEIVHKGLGKVGMTITQDAKQQIARLSQGLPHYTHALALYAGQEAVNQDRINIELADVDAAVRTAVSSAQQSLVGAYHRATISPRENLYQQVLLACALAPTDELGYFSAVDVRGPMSKIMNKLYDIPAFSRHLNDFCETTRGPVLQKTGQARRFKFRFTNPLMEPFVIMKGLADHLVARDLLEMFS